MGIKEKIGKIIEYKIPEKNKDLKKYLKGYYELTMYNDMSLLYSPEKNHILLKSTSEPLETASKNDFQEPTKKQLKEIKKEIPVLEKIVDSILNKPH